MLLTLGGGGGGGGGGAMYKAHLMLGGSGGMLPQENLRPSEITSGVFSSKFTLPIYEWTTPLVQKKTLATNFQGGARLWQGGGGHSPPLNEPLHLHHPDHHIMYSS